MRAMTLLAQAGLPLPPSPIADRDPAWQGAMELVYAAAALDDQALAAAWETFAVDHPDALASFVGKLKGVERINQAGALLDRLESTIPAVASRP